MRREYLLDKEFLQKLDRVKTKEIYGKLISLDLEENFVEEIIGRVISGNINIDGSSSMRRTCSISLAAHELNIHSYYWGLKTKFRLEIGLRNNINKKYPDIVWFPQGTYVISSFSTNQQLNQYTISISGKDKMCLLNGEMGGSINGPYNFSKDGDNNDIIIRKIIQGIVQKFAFEPLQNIIIKDLEDWGINLMEYRGTAPMYVMFDANSGEVNNFTLDGSITVTNEDGQTMALQDLNTDNTVFNSLFELNLTGNEASATIFEKGNTRYTIAKIQQGQSCGYQMTDLTYIGDLIGNVGESATNILDKIVTMLGGFEYFYNLDGQFVFQQKPIYVSTSWNSIKNNFDEQFADNKAYTSIITYSFIDSILINSFQNQPNFSNLRNDFSIWGTRKSAAGTEIPIHMRYAIDEKPISYKTYNGIYFSTLDGIDIKDNEYYGLDWREIIYQMAIDFRDYNDHDDFYIRLAQQNPQYPSGKTGYEVYYTDMEGFWRQLYNIAPTEGYAQKYVTKRSYDYSLTGNDKLYYEQSDWVSSEEDGVFHSGVTYYEDYPDQSYLLYGFFYSSDIESGYAKKVFDSADGLYYKVNDTYKKILSINELDFRVPYYFIYDSSNVNMQKGFKRAVKLTKAQFDSREDKIYYYQHSDREIKIECDWYNKYNPGLYYYTKASSDYGDDHWMSGVKESPESLNFWFDFLDTDGEIGKYSVKNIGARPKSVNDNTVKAIYFRETPNVVFVPEGEQIEEQSGYTYVQIQPDMEKLFTLSAQGKSAKYVLDQFLYQYVYCTESINFTSIPIYYLEPNTRIFIQDDKTGIDGEYILNRISLQLGSNGTMNLQAIKATDRIY